MGKLIKQILKFSVVGIIAFIIDFGIFTGIVYLGKFTVGETLISQGWFTVMATTIGFTVSVIFNYIASMKYVFTHKEEMSKSKEFIIFLILSIIGLLINDYFVWLFAHGISWPFTLSQDLLDMGAKVVATFIVTTWNFVTRKIFLDAGEKDDNQSTKQTRN